MAFLFEPLAIPDVVVITPQFFKDYRGGFSEVFKHSDFKFAGVDPVSGGAGAIWRQINWSTSVKNVLRGMHYQLPPHEQGKLVSVIVGTIYDVVIDIRSASPSFGQWVGITLDAQQRQMVWVPPGFAHGFCVMSEVAEVTYNCTIEYSPQSERGIIWSDPAVGITWPTKKPILSDKDAKYPSLASAETNFQ
jgi:dTDP-4-dehydrorhamnose 3,5-epimerase